MAIAVYTSDLTILIPDDVASTGNRAALGGGASGLNIETDYFIQGVNCMSKNAFASATKGMVEDTTNTLLTTGDLKAIYSWITHLTPGSLDTKANGGIQIVAGSSSTVFNTYNYAGSDTIDYGAPWICAVVDPENATASTGTVLHTAMDTYGGQAKLVGGPTKGAPLGIDAIRQGRSYSVTAGDIATPATFTGASAKNDLQANRYGQLQGVPGISGSYTMQCHFEIGTVATAGYFKDSNFSISLNHLEFVSPDFILFEVVNIGTTCIWENGTISAVGSNTKGNFLATSSLLIQHTGMTFNDMGTFVYDSNSTIDGTKFVRTDLITQNSATISNSTISFTNETFHNRAVDFDGSTEYMAKTTDQTIGLANAWTMSCWIIGSSIGTDAQLFNIRNLANNNNIIRFRIVSSKLEVHTRTSSGGIIKTYLSSVTLSNSTKYNLLATWNGTNLKLYIDGVEDTTPTKTVDNSGTMTDSSRAIGLGAREDGSQPFSGKISRGDLWNVALDGSNITELVDSGNGYKRDNRDNVGNYDQSSALKHQWALGKNTGTNIGEDFVSSGNINISDDSTNISDTDIVTFGTFTDSSALLSDNPALISDTTFNSDGTGHGIEIDTAGTYTFSGNKFNGFASVDGSTGNEAIYNNSGGAVTLNIEGGGDTPTIRNGVSATTTVNNTVTLKFTINPSFIDYEWRLYSVTAIGSLDGSVELAGEEYATTDNQTYTYSYTVDTPIAIQIISQPDHDYEEKVYYDILTSANKDFTITLTPDTNN